MFQTSLNSLRFLLGSVNGDGDTQWSYNWMILMIMFLMMMVMMKMMTMTMMITRLCREWHFCKPSLKQTKEDDCWKQNLATSNDPILKGSLTPHHYRGYTPANYYGTKNRGWEDDFLLKGLIFSFHFCPFKVEIRFFHLRHKPSTCPRGALYFRCSHVLVQAPKMLRPMLPLRLIQRWETSDFHVRDGTKIS